VGAFSPPRVRRCPTAPNDTPIAESEGVACGVDRGTNGRRNQGTHRVTRAAKTLTSGDGDLDDGLSTQARARIPHARARGNGRTARCAQRLLLGPDGRSTCDE